MIHNIVVDGVNQALPEALHYLKVCGDESPSRNGPVVRALGQVAITYKKSWQRVLFSPKRNANPFFHCMEALWMLAGREDVSFVAQFASRMKQFSDDGVTLNGAYGYRWRRRWFDQINAVIAHLQKNSESRREVITMWSPYDLDSEGSKDLPCNVCIFVDIRNGALNITVCNRSNDLWWGALGANAVHFSFLHEFLAQSVGALIGEYVQFSNNLHIYTELYDGNDILERAHQFEYDGPYPEPHFPLIWDGEDITNFLHEVEKFVSNGLESTYNSRFLTEVACPMLRAWGSYKAGDFSRSLEACSRIGAEDWKKACTEWVQRMEFKRGEKT